MPHRKTEAGVGIVKRLLVLAVTAALVPLSFIGAPYPYEMTLQHIPTFAGIAVLAAAAVWMRPSALSFYSVLAFLWIHILGARWIYSFVPYDLWVHTFAGFTLSDHFGWTRNHYDRLVHLCSGLFGVPPASELLQRYGGMRPLGAALMGISAVLAVGAVYEIIEWQLAMTLSPAQAEAYNGQQGDVWDPQKDMALAGLGAIIACGLLFRWRPGSVAQAGGR